MENIEQKKVRPSDEIDLIELFSRMWIGIVNGAKWLVHQLKNLLILVVRKSIWIGVFAAAGIIIGYFLYAKVGFHYSSYASLRSNGITNTHVIDFVNQFNGLIANGNKKAISEKLGIEESRVAEIKSIGAYYGIDINKDRYMDYIDYDNTYDPLDTLQQRLPVMVYLRLDLKKDIVFNDLKKAIIDYVSTNPFIIVNNNIRTKQAHETIKAIETEISKLDSLQKLQYFDVPRTQRSASNQMIVLNEKDFKLYHETLLGLQARKQDLEKELELYPEPITIIQPFTELGIEKGNLFKELIKKAILGALIGFIVSILWQYRKEMISAVKNGGKQE